MLVSASVFCLALNVYHEARSEDYLGQLAVAEVTLNRVASNKYPDTVCDVVWQRKQFSWTHDGKSDKPYERTAWVRAVKVASDALETEDMSVVGEGVTHYHADYVTPSWSRKLTRVARVGRHVFYRSEG